MSDIFEMELYRKDKIGASTTLKLPATPFEIADALDKLRITDKTAPYQTEILSCKRGGCMPLMWKTYYRNRSSYGSRRTLSCLDLRRLNN